MLLQNSLYFISTVLYVISCLFTQAKAAVHSAHIYKSYSQQLGQLVTSSTLVWETYINDTKQLEFTVQGGIVVTEDEHYPIYVCRALVEGIYVSGHTEKRRQKYVCVIGQSSTVKAHSNFDILTNKGHLGKLTWKPWNKFVVGIPSGTVSVSGNSQGDEIYIARHRIRHNSQQHEENREHGADYALGRFEPREGLGRIIVTEMDKEKDYREGELLVESEPSKYELRDINIDRSKLSRDTNQTELNSAILANRGEETNLVETVISYEYDRVQFWGTYDGTARGLVTKIYEHRSLPPEIINWGMRYSERRVETKTVSTNLRPGTALNVTLKGSYTTIYAPYTATLVTFYNDTQDNMSRMISSDVKKSDLHDIKFEFSPIYWIDNGTILPTTTTTSTTTTEPTSTTTKEPNPIYSPPVVKITDLGGSSSSSSSKESDFTKKHMDDMEVGNDIAADQSRESEEGGKEKKTEKQYSSSGFSIRINNSILSLIIGCTWITLLRLIGSSMLLY